MLSMVINRHLRYGCASRDPRRSFSLNSSLISEIYFVCRSTFLHRSTSNFNAMTDTETILRNLSLSLYGKTAAATFACGGTLTTKISPVAETSSSQPASLFLFYEDKGGEAHRLDFPASAQGMEHLASVCEQATFGRNTEDVLDTEYRSAWKLDNTKFSCSLHPADYDVVEVIRQLLFPGAVHSDIETAIGVELYKLNVYSILFKTGLLTW